MLPTTTKAAILVEQRAPLVIDEVELPKALDYGQVLVKLSYSGICGSQLGEIDGVKGPDRYLPHLLGHEGSGAVVAVGPQVSTVEVGDAVVLHWKPGRGIEARPPVYLWKGKPLNAGWVTTFNEYAVVSENRVTAVPAWLDPEVGALLGCAVTTGLGVITNDAAVKIGESVVVWGAGGVGLNIVQGAAMAGAFPIVAVDLHDHKLELAQELGATHLVNATTEDPVRAIKAAVGDAGADVVIDNTGNVGVIESAYGLTKPQGRTILVGVPPSGKKPSISSLPLHFGKVLRGSHGGDTQPERDIPRYAELVRAGRLPLSKLVTDYIDLDEINDAIDCIRAGDVIGRCLVRL